MNPPRHILTHHFTASGLVICNEHILLVHHNRIGAWVPPGGHIEADELPEQTVVREIQEETGVEVEVLAPECAQTGDPDAFFLANPLYVQSVLAIEKGQRYYHIDLAYLCRPSLANQVDSKQLPLLAQNAEVKEARWVALGQTGDLPLAKNVKEALDMLEGDGMLSRFRRVAWHSGDIDKPVQ